MNRLFSASRVRAATLVVIGMTCGLVIQHFTEAPRIAAMESTLAQCVDRLLSCKEDQGYDTTALRRLWRPE